MNTNNYPKYATYKPSGNLSLGEIPIDWQVSRIAHVFLKSNAGEVIDKSYWGDGKELLYTCNRTPIQSDFSKFPQWKRTVKNDLLLTRNGTPYVHMPMEGAIYSNVVQRITLAKQFFREYLSYCLGNSALGMRGYGVSIESFNFDNWKSLRFAHPPLEEQAQIAKFLDYETAEIDTLIEKQEQLIALLKEKRQAVISHAVTKGLNPDAPMRDSGVEWLGRVPAHWEVCRVKQATSFRTSGPRGWSDLITEDGLDIFLQSGDLNDKLGLKLDTAKRIIHPRNAEGVRSKMQVGDVVVCITGANTGRVAVAEHLNETVFVNQHLSLLRPEQERVYPRFLGTILTSSSLRTYFTVKQYGVKEGLSLTNVAEAPLCLPPLHEQNAIITHLIKIENKIDRLEEVAIEQVELLQERRSALISAAVTGKIDVRGWQPPQSTPPTESP